MKCLNEKEEKVVSGAVSLGAFNPMIEYFDPFSVPFSEKRDLSFVISGDPVSTLPCTACTACTACSACK